MTETLQMWIEILFDLAYLVVIWGLVLVMDRRRESVLPENRAVAKLFLWALFLLALGDTGHVGFRIVGYAIGDLDAQFSVLGFNIGLLGGGTLATAITVTLFYVLLLFAWRARFGSDFGWFGYVLFAAAAMRFSLMVDPANQWNSLVPPQPWAIVRNVPFFILGGGVTYLMLREALNNDDRTFFWIGISIIVSFACYIPVIFFVQKVPMLGMLMIPKTVAYVVIGLIAYKDLYPKLERR